MSETQPCIADIAAVAGLDKKVRDPGPCLPSKFQFDVETQYFP